MFYFARCMNIIFNSLLAQLVKYVHTTRKIKSIRAIFYHMLLFYACGCRMYTLFAKSLPLDVASRVWDVFCRDGEEFLFRTALGLPAAVTCVIFYHIGVIYRLINHY